MFQLEKNPKNDYFNISIDGVTYLRSYVYDRGKDYPNQIFQYNLRDKEVSQKLINYKLSDFGDFEHLSLGNVFDWCDFDHSLSVTYRYDNDEGLKPEFRKTGKVSISFYFNPYLVEWGKQYSFSNYYKAFEDLWNRNKDLSGELKFYADEEMAFALTKTFDEFTLPISEFLSPYIIKLQEIHIKAINYLNSKVYKESISATFNFPEDLKASCEQYLLYFAQFLRDLGINSTSNLKEEAGKVLFSVTPTDDIEALDKIRDALAVYLNLPASPIVYDDSFAAMRLQQQIENLQHSQRMAEREIRSADRELRLAQTVIEHQDKIIHQKDTIIEQQNKVIEKITSKSIMMDSLENKEEFEKVFDGLEFGESKELKEKLGIKFNPVTSLKSLGKTLIGQDEEITALNLGEQEEAKDV